MSSFPKVSVFGYGSLMDESSALRTMSSMSNFRQGTLLNHVRVFTLASLSGIKMFSDTKEFALMAIRPADTFCVKGSIFDIEAGQLESYFRREFPYKPQKVVVQVDSSHTCECWTVLENSDDEYTSKFTVEQHEWFQRNYHGSMWGRTDIFPMRDYLNRVIAAAHSLGGDDWMENILHETILADGSTLKHYLQTYPSRFNYLLATFPSIITHVHLEVESPSAMTSDHSNS